MRCKIIARHISILVLLTSFFLAITLQSNAQLITNGFEDLPGCSFYVGSGVPPESDLSDYYAASGVIFSTIGGAPYVAVVDLGDGHAPSGMNGIGSVDSSATLEYGYPMLITFVQPNNPSAPAVTDIVSIKNDLIPLGYGAVTMQAYGMDGALLATATNVDDQAFTIGVTNAGIHSVIMMQGNTVAFDDLVYDTPVAPIISAPPVSLAIHSATVSQQPAVALTWPALTNHIYQIEWSSDLTTNLWSGLGSSLAGNGTTNTVYDTISTNSRFYRLVTLQ